MKSYPTMSRFERLTQSQLDRRLSEGNDLIQDDCYIFAKLDGSNVRAEWTKRKAFCKFGSRKQLIDPDDPILGRVPDMILNKYGDDLSRICQEQRWQKATFFFEFLGENSFAGQHNPYDVKDVVLIDVSPHKMGMLPPTEFLRLFGELDHAELLHQGALTIDLYSQIVSGTLENMPPEGVIIKRDLDGKAHATKLKTQAWLDRLKQKCGADKALYEWMK